MLAYTGGDYNRLSLKTFKIWKEDTMNEIYKSYEELPLMLSVSQLAMALGISRASAYALVRQADFPSLSIGNRIVIPKDKFMSWVEKNCA